MSTMTQALSPAHATRYTSRHTGPASRPRLVSARFAAALLSSFGALTSFYLLLSVTPMYAMSAGAGSAGAGLVTGSLIPTTVLAEVAPPRLLGRFGYRAVFAAGALLLGGPAPALLLPHSMATIIAVSIARGIGFGLATVVLGALVAASVPAERRGEGIGLAGVVACVPAIVALPSGVWLAQNTGYAVVIAITAISALAPLAATPWLPDPGGTGPGRPAGRGGPREGRGPPTPGLADPGDTAPAGQQAGSGHGEAGSGHAETEAAPAGLLSSLRSGGMLRPGLVFAATTIAAGVVASFLARVGGVFRGLAHAWGVA